MKATIEGPLHSVRVKLVTKRTLKKLWGVKGDVVFGMYDDEKNTIYVAKEQTPEQQLQTLMHEIGHMLEAQMANMEEESKAEVLGSWLTKFFGLSSIEDVLT